MAKPFYRGDEQWRNFDYKTGQALPSYGDMDSPGTGRIRGMFDPYVQQGGQTMEGGLGSVGQATDYYGGVLAGTQPSLAQQQLQAGMGQNYAQGLAMANAGRGGNIGGAARQASMAAGQSGQALAQAQAMQRAAELQGAASGLGELGMQQAGLGLQQQQGSLGMMNEALMGEADRNLQGMMGNRALDLQAQNQRAQQKQAKWDLAERWINNAWQGFATMFGGGKSDPRAKKNVSDGRGAVRETFGAVDPTTFDYRDGMGPPGRHASLMANELARTPLGDQLVYQGPDGYQTIDGMGATMANMAHGADLEHRMRQIESALGLGERPQGRRGMGY